MSGSSGHVPRKANLPDPNAPCSNKELHANTRNIENLSARHYWAAICPELTVGKKHANSTPKRNKKATLNDWCSQIKNEGVFQVHRSDMDWQADIHCLARNMVILMQHGWPATFLLMFDEVWSLIQHASGLMATTTGNACNLDVLCWYVDPNRGDAGFSPHRDRQPDDSSSTFRSKCGLPMYSTCWVALTDACPENSCLYMLPRWADPGYYKGDDDDGLDPLTVALRSKESFQAIRAFPAEAGSAIVFSHRIIHWGSRGRKGYHTPRLAISWGCADDAYEPPYFSREHLPYPPSELRAALACGQMLVYHERFPMTKRQLSMYYKFFKLHADKFHGLYRAKVLSEFVAATKELVAAPPPLPLAAASNRDPRGAVMTNGVENGDMTASEEGEEDSEGGWDGVAANRNDGSTQGPHVDGQAQRVKKDKKKRTAEDPSGGGSGGATGAPHDAALKDKALKIAKKIAASKAEAAMAAKAAEATVVRKMLKAKKAAVKVTAAEKAPVAEKKSKKREKAEAVASAEKKTPVAERELKKAKILAAAATTAAATGKAAALRDQSEAAKSSSLLRADGGKVGQLRDQSDQSDHSGEDEEEEEEGSGWEGLLAAGGGDSEDEVMEDALDAMLDAKLAGREDGLVDDFDDFDEDDM